jgi:hypothetical protein
MSNFHGKATAITVLTPVKWPWTIWLRAFLWLGQRFPSLTKDLRKLSFIHFARWTIITAPAYNGAPQEREKLNYKYLFFESNFNGTWDQYIDAFSNILPRGMRVIWGSSYGMPGPLPVAPFKRYIRKNEYVASHYYSAYPDATTTTILAADRVRGQLPELAKQARSLPPDEFAAAYRSFLTDMQKSL